MYMFTYRFNIPYLNHLNHIIFTMNTLIIDNGINNKTNSKQNTTKKVTVIFSKKMKKKLIPLEFL